MEQIFGVDNQELLEAYVNQLTQLRVMKVHKDADIVQNLLAREREGESGSDTSDDPLRGFVHYDEDVHKVLDFQQGIRETSDRIECHADGNSRG